MAFMHGKGKEYHTKKLQGLADQLIAEVYELFCRLILIHMYTLWNHA